MKKAVNLLVTLILLGSGTVSAAEMSEYDIQAWGLTEYYWPAVAKSRIPLYGLLKKEGKQYRFVRFSTMANINEPWIHLPSRKPTWNIGRSYCRYAIFASRSCPSYEPSQFMKRDLEYIGSTLGGLLTLGLMPLINGVPANFRFDERGFNKSLKDAYKAAGIDAEKILQLTSAWEILSARQKEGDFLVEKARYNVSVDGTGETALKGISAKWLVAPSLSYPWLPQEGLTDNDFPAFTQHILGLSQQYARTPLKDIAVLGKACPDARASALVMKADCSGVTVSWHEQGLTLDGGMAILQWRLPMPQQLTFDSASLRINYDNGALIVRNKALATLTLSTLGLEAFDQHASVPLQRTTIMKGDKAFYLGFVDNGKVRGMELQSPVLTPAELSQKYVIRAHATYNVRIFLPEVFSIKQELVASDTIRSELEAIQKGEVRLSIDEREYIARSQH